jgi:hypothetical protein
MSVRQVPLADGEVLEAYRFVTTDALDAPTLENDFKSNYAKGCPPRGRELREPLIHRGLSMFKTLAQARDRRQRIAENLRRQGRPEALRMGAFAARVRLVGPGVAFEDLQRVDGHITVWAEPSRCLEDIVEIVRIED